MPGMLPHSEFLSWDADDQDKALAFRRVQAELCPRCSTRESDWWDEHEMWHVPPLLEVVPHKCPGCGEIERVSDAVREEDPHARGLTFRAEVVKGT